MSGWKIITRKLYDAGKPMPARKIDDGYCTYGGLFSALREARDIGMIVNTLRGTNGHDGGRWAITPMGIDWAEGRIEVCRPHWDRGSTRAHRPVATWLKALPRAGEIRLGQQ